MKSLLFIPKCWVTRHHWLLTGTFSTNKLFEYQYVYVCQVCGSIEYQEVMHLDDVSSTEDKYVQD